MTEKWETAFNRRGLFNFAWQEAGRLAGKAVTRKLSSALLRPPGALPEPAFLTACTRCGLCVSNCPAKILYTAPADSGVIFGTPVVNFAGSYCKRCRECVRGCASGALSAKAETGIGLAQIDSQKCLVRQGNLCGLCLFNCQEKAIVYEGSRLLVQTENCKGCGKCKYLCPVTKAISIMR